MKTDAQIDPFAAPTSADTRTATRRGISSSAAYLSSTCRSAWNAATVRTLPIACPAEPFADAYAAAVCFSPAAVALPTTALAPVTDYTN